METLTLIRSVSSDTGTKGQLTMPDGTVLYTMELPYSDPWVSNFTCIPTPTDPNGYVCKNLFSPKHNRNLYHVTNVPGCEEIEIHVGNFGGNTRLKDTDGNQLYQSDILGCILLGTAYGQTETTHLKDKNGNDVHKLQDAVLNSTVAINDIFMKQMNNEDFYLKIQWL
jgi:hypothetical protein